MALRSEETVRRNKSHSLEEIQCTGHTGRVTDAGLRGDGIGASSEAALGRMGRLHGGHWKPGMRVQSSDSSFTLKGHIIKGY